MSTQRPLFEPPKEWNPPQTLPDLSEAKEIAIDLETYDPGIKDTGPGWATGKGHVVGIAIAVEGFKGYYPLRHEGGGNFDEDIVRKHFKKYFSDFSWEDQFVISRGLDYLQRIRFIQKTLKNQKIEKIP